jgi:putative transposase
MESVLKIKLTLDEADARVLDGQSKIINWLYNHLLEQANKLRTEYIASQDKKLGLTLYSKRGLRNLIPEIKKSHPFLKSVHSSPLKNGALRLSESIMRFQKEKSKGKRGWPRFRSWRQRFFSLLYDEPNKAKGGS